MIHIPDTPVYAIDHAGRHDVTYVIIFTLSPGREDTFLGLIAPVLNAMRMESTFLNAVLHRDPLKPNRFMLYETWSDADDVVNVQIHREYRQDFWASLPGLLASDREIQTWTPIRADVVPIHYTG